LPRLQPLPAGTGTPVRAKAPDPGGLQIMDAAGQRSRRPAPAPRFRPPASP